MRRFKIEVVYIARPPCCSRRLPNIPITPLTAVVAAPRAELVAELPALVALLAAPDAKDPALPAAPEAMPRADVTSPTGANLLKSQPSFTWSISQQMIEMEQSMC